jgi:transcriptional regulator with GAF, ATPase, and Fis domain
MTTTPPIPEQRTYAPRQRDRRHGFAEWLSALARSMDRRTDVSALRDMFESGLRTVVRARSVQFREPGHRWPSRAIAPLGSESMALEIPGLDHASSGVLEVTFDPECHLGEWDFQTLTMAAHVGSLVLEVERSRTQAFRSSVSGGLRHRRDAAAPLIGSTPAMEQLRRTIERVAGTDFTVLLEGPSDPQ